MVSTLEFGLNCFCFLIRLNFINCFIIDYAIQGFSAIIFFNSLNNKFIKVVGLMSYGSLFALLFIVTEFSPLICFRICFHYAKCFNGFSYQSYNLLTSIFNELSLQNVRLEGFLVIKTFNFYQNLAIRCHFFTDLKNF